MKKVLLYTLGVIAISATLTLQSCDKLKKAVPAQDITFTGANADLVIPPASDTTQQGSLGQATLSYNLDSMIKAQTGGALGYNNIQSVKITSIKLTLNDADASNNFANFVYAGGAFNSDANGGNYPAYTVAYVDNNPDTYSTVLSPPVVDASQDVKKYFNSQMTFYYLVIAKLRRPTTKTLHCHVDISYDITLKAS